ncbi:uncharacterized protein LOC135119921 [Zophobas morio]|uniref:uncharacterized protein LOC135119921 n=1 Tax=Zophobas morio TaxID=2755281 RepID=UPI003082A6AE
MNLYFSERLHELAELLAVLEHLVEENTWAFAVECLLGESTCSYALLYENCSSCARLQRLWEDKTSVLLEHSHHVGTANLFSFLSLSVLPTRGQTTYAGHAALFNARVFDTFCTLLGPLGMLTRAFDKSMAGVALHVLESGYHFTTCYPELVLQRGFLRVPIGIIDYYCSAARHCSEQLLRKSLELIACFISQKHEYSGAYEDFLRVAWEKIVALSSKHALPPALYKCVSLILFTLLKKCAAAREETGWQKLYSVLSHWSVDVRWEVRDAFLEFLQLFSLSCDAPDTARPNSSFFPPPEVLGCTCIPRDNLAENQKDSDLFSYILKEGSQDLLMTRLVDSGRDENFYVAKDALKTISLAMIPSPSFRKYFLERLKSAYLNNNNNNTAPNPKNIKYSNMAYYVDYIIGIYKSRPHFHIRLSCFEVLSSFLEPNSYKLTGARCLYCFLNQTMLLDAVKSIAEELESLNQLFRLALFHDTEYEVRISCYNFIVVIMWLLVSSATFSLQAETSQTALTGVRTPDVLCILKGVNAINLLQLGLDDVIQVRTFLKKAVVPLLKGVDSLCGASLKTNYLYYGSTANLADKSHAEEAINWFTEAKLNHLIECKELVVDECLVKKFDFLDSLLEPLTLAENHKDCY